MGKCISPLKAGVKILHLQRGGSSIHQAHTWPEIHGSCLARQLVVLAVCSFIIAGCTNARIVNETATGGTVLYSYVEEQDVLTSPGRKDALLLLDEKCPSGYRITREGQVAQIGNAVDKAWMGQVSRDGQPNREKRWAIQFACK